MIENTFHTLTEVQLDARGRLTLGKAAQGVSRYQIAINEHTGEILLTPMVSISAREAAILAGSEVMTLLREGLSDAAEGRVTKRSFMQREHRV